MLEILWGLAWLLPIVLDRFGQDIESGQWTHRLAMITLSLTVAQSSNQLLQLINLSSSCFQSDEKVKSCSIDKIILNYIFILFTTDAVAVLTDI